MSFRHLASITVAAVIAASAATASTVTIGVTSYGVGSGQLATARADQALFHGTGLKIVEDFERFQFGSPSFSAATIETRVGDFTNITPNGSGGTDLSPTDLLHVRDGSGNNGVRFNTTFGGSNYLDSNDNSGIHLGMPGSASLPGFRKLSFLATDIDDVGAPTFNIDVSGDATGAFTLADVLPGSRSSGELLLFTMLFDHVVQDVAIKLNIDSRDGFAIDDVTVSPVPLPAAAWMLIAGVGALAGVARSRRKG